MVQKKWKNKISWSVLVYFSRVCYAPNGPKRKRNLFQK